MPKKESASKAKTTRTAKSTKPTTTRKESKPASTMSVSITQLTKLAEADPKLAEEIYHRQMNIKPNIQWSGITELAKISPKLAGDLLKRKQKAEAYQALAKFQAQMPSVPEPNHVDSWNRRQRRYLPMYYFAHFSDVSKAVKKAMVGTGLSFTQVPEKGSLVRIPVLDNHGKPTYQVEDKPYGYTKGKYPKPLFKAIRDANGHKIYNITMGEVVYCKTYVFYKNGYVFPAGCETTVSQSTSPQDVGTAESYAKKYSLAKAVGAEGAPDTDGQQSHGGSRVAGRPTTPASQAQQQAPVMTISSSQARSLNGLINQMATNRGYSGQKAQQFIKQAQSFISNRFGSPNNTVVNIPKIKFNSAKNYAQTLLQPKK